MTDPITQPTCLALDDVMCGVNSIHFDKKYNEFFAIGDFEDVAVSTLSGQLITHQRLAGDTQVIAQQRTISGWQFICKKETDLSNCTIDKNNVIKTLLIKPMKTARTAAWSPCGQYVAIGSEECLLSVWNTQTGNLVMQKPINWSDDAEFFNPPTLSVVSWSESGEEIITIAGSGISCNVLVWDFANKKLITIIQ